MLKSYLKQFEEWAIALREKFSSDLFFRTTVYVVGLQALLAALCILAFWWALHYMNGQISGAIVENITAALTNHPTYQEGVLPQEIGSIQLRGVWFMFAGVVALAVLFGVVLSRFTLKPARQTLRQQKLFISNVAHELRTPLAVIKTSTEVALLDDTLTHPQRKTFGEILVELDRVSEIINNLLSLNTLTRPERMQFENVDLGPLTDMVIKRHEALAQERGIEIVCKKDGYRVAWGNPFALEQIVTNLLRNALSYTPKNKGGMVTVSIHPDYHGSIAFSISDTGIGIAQKDLFHIFEPFYRPEASRTRAGRGGSGLGLTIVNELVRLHRGKIHIESAKGRGTTVSVFLPAGTSREEEREGKRSPEVRHEVSMDFSRGNNRDTPRSRRSQ